MKKTSKYLSRLILAVASVLTANASGQANAFDPKSPVCKLISLPYLLGAVALNLGEPTVIQKTMPCLLKLWEEQLPDAGKANIELSNSFLFIMEENPQLFLSAMTAQPRVFTDWLNNLAKLSFSSGQETRCVNETKRKQLVNLLEKVDLVGKAEQALKKSILATLSEIPKDRGCA